MISEAQRQRLRAIADRVTPTSTGGGVALALEKQATATLARNLFKLQGAASPPETALEEVINAIVDELNNTAKVFNVKQYGGIGDNSTDNSAAIAAAYAAAKAAGGGTVYFPSEPGEVLTVYRFTLPIEIINADGTEAIGIRFVGDVNRRVWLVYVGAATRCMVDLRSRECVFESLTFCQGSFGVTVTCGFEVTAATDGSIVLGSGASTAHQFTHVDITAFPGCTLTYGLRAGERVDSVGTIGSGPWPQNNDMMKFYDVGFYNCDYAGVYTRCDGGNQIFWSFRNCIFGYMPYGIYVGDDGELGFNAYHTVFTRISEIAMRIRIMDATTVQGLDIEQVKRLLYVDGPTSSGSPITITGARCTIPAAGVSVPYDLPADGRWIDIQYPGPVTLQGMLFFVNGFASSNFNIRITGPGDATVGSVATLITDGCYFPQVPGGVDAIGDITGRGLWIRRGCNELPPYPNDWGLGARAVDDCYRQYGYPYTTQVGSTGSTTQDKPLAMRANRFGDTESEAVETWTTGTPEASVVAVVGSRAKDRSSKEDYYKATGSGNTGWVSASGPTTDVRTAAGPYTPARATWRIVVVNQTVGAAYTLNCPATPLAGDVLEVKDGKGDAAANNITIAGNGHNIDGATPLVISTNRGVKRLVYTGTEWAVT